jgi:hypothetical protein
MNKGLSTRLECYIGNKEEWFDISASEENPYITIMGQNIGRALTSLKRQS